MAILNCLWIGGLAGLAASRLIRHRSGMVPAASSMAVGVLGALLGSLVDHLFGAVPFGDLLAAALGAVSALAAWGLAHRLLPAATATESPAESR